MGDAGATSALSAGKKSRNLGLIHFFSRSSSSGVIANAVVDSIIKPSAIAYFQQMDGVMVALLLKLF
ncbi:MAG: hypothetical protein CTY22_10225 [Methylomonas sp.]|nr:MAG: hypothetical protein CTY23_05445 [Methylomonas sp.]PPD24892.1 MAG: hypothetical protein CTY22_10225 [Methylomonas sp.]PPD33888.1 MAG: hypothetical protein CTY21_10205 [Methylomonas sp.]PPD41463.1 MAG: hypothetical protein CTY17_04020 [Methylomonas sp.]PPD52289.1 MAG: hypothetical protein CTY11_09320 [Methylomonas sp.]